MAKTTLSHGWLPSGTGAASVAAATAGPAASIASSPAPPAPAAAPASAMSESPPESMGSNWGVRDKLGARSTLLLDAAVGVWGGSLTRAGPPRVYVTEGRDTRAPFCIRKRALTWARDSLVSLPSGGGVGYFVPQRKLGLRVSGSGLFWYALMMGPSPRCARASEGRVRATPTRAGAFLETDPWDPCAVVIRGARCSAGRDEVS